MLRYSRVLSLLISEDLTLKFATTHTEISDHERAIIIKAKYSLLFNNGEAWCKSSGESLSDVTMGSFDRAETCELVAVPNTIRV